MWRHSALKWVREKTGKFSKSGGPRGFAPRKGWKPSQIYCSAWARRWHGWWGSSRKAGLRIEHDMCLYPVISCVHQTLGGLHVFIKASLTHVFLSCWFSLFISGSWAFNTGFLDHSDISPLTSFLRLLIGLFFVNFHYDFSAPKWLTPTSNSLINQIKYKLLIWISRPH